MTAFQEFLSGCGGNMQVHLFLAGGWNLGLSFHIDEMGIIPIPHWIVVRIKALEEFRKNFMGKWGSEAGIVGTREGDTAHLGQEAGMAWGSEDPVHASLVGLKISEERLRI